MDSIYFSQHIVKLLCTPHHSCIFILFYYITLNVNISSVSTYYVVMKNLSYLTKFFFEYFNPSSHYLINNTIPFKQQNENNYEQFFLFYRYAQQLHCAPREREREST